MPREIQSDSFDHEVINSDKPVIAEFYSPTCIPCKNVEEKLKEAETMLGESAKVVKLNVFESPDQACKFSIMSVPTVIGFSKGRILNCLTGIRQVSEYVNLVKQS